MCITYKKYILQIISPTCIMPNFCTNIKVLIGKSKYISTYVHTSFQQNKNLTICEHPKY